MGLLWLAAVAEVKDLSLCFLRRKLENSLDVKQGTLFLRVVSSSAAFSLDGNWFPWPPGADYSPTKQRLAEAGETGSVYLALCPGLQLQVMFTSLLWQPAEHKGTWNQRLSPPHPINSHHHSIFSVSGSRKCIPSAFHSPWFMADANIDRFMSTDVMWSFKYYQKDANGVKPKHQLPAISPF